MSLIHGTVVSRLMACNIQAFRIARGPRDMATRDVWRKLKLVDTGIRRAEDSRTINITYSLSEDEVPF